MLKPLVIILVAGGVCSGMVAALNTRCERCVLVEDCPKYAKIFRRFPYSSQNVKFYATVACGFQGFSPKVCCQHDDTPPPERSSQNKEINYNKINEFCDIDEESQESKVVGGLTAPLGLFPWMAKLGYKERKRSEVVYRCGGSLVTRRHVLTAGHCLAGLPPDMALKVILLDADGSPVERRPEKLIPHPEFDSPPNHNDLGVIELDRAVDVTAGVRPVCLPLGAVRVPWLTARSLMVAGWGSVRSGSPVFSPRLRYARLSPLAAADCAVLLRPYRMRPGPGHLCTAPDPERDACAGDSGGPLFAWLGAGGGAQAVALGAVSLGGRRCGGAPAVYTRLEYYGDWIQEAVTL